MPTQIDRGPDRTLHSDGVAPDVTIVAHDIGSVGGMERQLAALVVGLRGIGHRVTVIARTCDLPPGTDVTFHRVPGPARPVLLAYPWFMAVASAILWRRRRGVVQATGAIVLNRVDVIAVHYCHQVGPAHPSRSTILFRLHAKLVGLMLRFAERRSFRANRSAVFVGVSEGVADEVRDHFPEVAEQTITIPNGVDTERFAPGVRVKEARALRAALKISPGRLVAVFVGSEWGRKGLDPLIEALALAPEWDLVVVGRGDQARYGALADSLGIGPAVRWVGVSRDVAPAYELADALVFPTSYEAFSLVMLEAAASGLPMLVTPVSGVSELVTDGREGFIISPEPQAIAERLGLLADAALRERMGRAARRSALDFRWETVAAYHHELYRRIERESLVRDDRE